MVAVTTTGEALDPRTRAVYQQAMRALEGGEVSFLIGGAYALAEYTGVVRHTKDFDIFLKPADCGRALDMLCAAGFRTELTFQHWLGKAFLGDNFLDIIFSSGNGVATVDDAWFDHAIVAEVLGLMLRLCPAEEMIWSKAFVMERERYDGADIAHLIRARGRDMDWHRLLHRFGPNWRVLLNYLVLFGFIYPSERAVVPTWVMDDLLGRLQEEMAAPPPAERICRGTLLSREQFLIDVQRWGYRDARVEPLGRMTPQATEQWTAAIHDEHTVQPWPCPPASPGSADYSGEVAQLSRDGSVPGTQA